MTANDGTAEKRIVEHLNFGSKTSKRVGWEAWEFAVVGPHQIEVTNASWGFLKDDHSYIVGIEERDGQPVPAECGCKADRFREEYSCKHCVACATVGGPVVLEAATEATTPGDDTGGSASETMADHLRADGGASTGETPTESQRLDEGEHPDCNCGDLPDDFPCADCYIEGRESFTQ